MQIAALSAALLVGYACCLAWALHRASRPTLLSIAAVTLIALGLRLVYPHQYPWGMHHDEVLVATGALRSYCHDRPWLVTGNNLQAGLYAATIGPLYAPLGLWWAARSYSVFATVVAVPLAWGTARSLGLTSLAALAGVALAYAVLPWSLAYGRTGIGGEVILNALVVLFALSKCASVRGWRLTAAGGLLWFGLVLCCFGYTAGKVMLVTALASTLTFPREGWTQRVAVVVAACAAAALLYNGFSGGRYAWYGFDVSQLPQESRPWIAMQANWAGALAFPWKPIHFTTCSQSLSSAVILPLPLLIIALTGFVVGLRRRTTWFLLIAFVLGLLPALLGPNGISSRRLLPAAMIIPFFIGMAIDRAPRRWRPVAAAAIGAGVLVWGPMTYFSPHFWTQTDKFAFCDVECGLAAKPSAGKFPTGCPTTAAVMLGGKSP